MRTKPKSFAEQRRPSKGPRQTRGAAGAEESAKGGGRLQVKLSDWEGEFLGSVEDRVETYGRAFRDPKKGGPASSLSMLQG